MPPACEPGDTQCAALAFQVCANGAFVTQRMCTTVCDAAAGCMDPPPPDECKVPSDELDAPPECEEQALPDSFEPDVQWTFDGMGAEVNSIVTPLVANLTDDNDDGEIDLCDVPDVVLVASSSSGSVGVEGHIYVLDGQTGTLHFRIDTAVDHTVTPALGDIDDDGIPEIVTAGVDSMLLAFEHDGILKWTGDTLWGGAWVGGAYSESVALADVDNDGDVEIIHGRNLSDHTGTGLWSAPDLAGNWSATAAADLDADGDLEIVLGHAAYRHDGTLYYDNDDISPGYPQIADLDGDGEPDVLVTNINGISLLDHDGTTVYKDLRPTDVAPTATAWLRPATIHDFDGDGEPEFAVSSASEYSVYEADATIHWTATVSDASGIAAGTAFDFLGDGIAEAMYADEQKLFIFDGAGAVLLEASRLSGTLSEYPVVADIDNDGSAEILVVSNSLGEVPGEHTLQAIRDIEDRWIQARRIWNQHTYHVTNVREDGTIPQFEPASWEHLNTFRTNAQIEGGAVCEPDLF